MTNEFEPFEYTPTGYQGPAQHTYTPQCDGFHEPGPCPQPDPEPVTFIAP